MDVGLFLGTRPWEIRHLKETTSDEMDLWLRADQRRFNRLVRLVVWAITFMPIAVMKGISMGAFGAEPRTALRKFTSRELLNGVPGYDAAADENVSDEDEAE